jgi:hypothetical protein
MSKENLCLGDAERLLVIVEIPFSTEASSHTFSSLGIFHAALFAGLEVHRVLFDLFYDSFLLHFPLEPLKSLFDRFSIVNDNECH